VRQVADSIDREAWLAARDVLVTASDVPKMLLAGYSKTEDERLQQRDVLRTQKAFGAPEETQEQWTIARYLEEAVLAYARGELGWKVEHNTGLWVDDACPLLGATPDGVLTDEDGVECDVEVKCTASPATEDCAPTGTAMMKDGPPLHWKLQNMAQMAVSGRQRGYILVLHHFDRKGLKVRHYKVERHESIVERIKSDVVCFWGEVAKIKNGEAT
jgi:predicted phage-related endonuclease